MKKLALAMGVVLLLAAAASAELCRQCRGMMYTQDIGVCVECGAQTSSGAFKLCKTCSVKLNQCKHCRKALVVDPKVALAEKVEAVDTSKSGTYTSGKWVYEYSISAKGSRSERRSGTLTHDGKPISDARELDRIQTPWGMMQYFGEKGMWNSGWLLKQTYDQPIDPKKGRLLPDPGKPPEKKPAEQCSVNRKPVALRLTVVRAPCGPALFSFPLPFRKKAG
jgi:hypothetical protein